MTPQPSRGAAWLACPVLFVLLALTGGCKDKNKSDPSGAVEKPESSAKTESAAASDDTQAVVPAGQWYRATLDFEENGKMPFFMLLPEGKSGSAYFKNGEELVEASFAWAGETLSIESPWAYTSILRGEKDASGTLRGDWTRDTPLWGEVVRDFHAEPVDSPDPATRFPGKPGDLDVSGVWKFNFEHHGDGIGVLTQKGDVVSGFVRPGSLGDMRFMTGNVRPGKLSLSTFNGNSANLLVASGDGARLEGTISMQNVWIEGFTATRADESYEHTNSVKLDSKNHKVELPELEAYEGKPTVLILFATWCPSCNDATPFLVRLEKEYRDQGVKFHSISFDLSEDEEATEKEIVAFKKKYDLPWTVTQRPTTPERWQADMPPEVKGWDGLPITIFIDRKGEVQNIYGGWFGPAAPEASADLKQTFRDWTAAIAKSE